jgi:CRISPR/Cas system CSM-associated protein Csm3 (group 7 of RAMP superfamily)
MNLTVRFLDYWHVGSGRGLGKHLDAVVDKDASGLPYVPGRMLKGLLRDAVWRLESWGHPGFARGCTRALFGTRPDEADRHTKTDGCVYISDARLSDAISNWLADPAQRDTRAALYRQIYATAIDERRGCARKNSLRGIEVVVPVTLAANLTVECAASPGAPDPQALIGMALPLIQAVGAHRSRGLGRVVLTLETQP